MNQRSHFGGGYRRQLGAGLMAILLIVFTIALGYLVSQLSPLTRMLERQSAAGARMAEAKESLMAFNFGQSGDPRDPDKMSLGRFPLPDMGRRGISDAVMTNDHEGEAASGFAGNNANTILLGRLPWKTLGIPPIYDENGECLWYGLSAAWKNTNNQTAGDPLRYVPPTYNWDTLGDFDLYGSDLQKVSNNPHQNRAVAVIFSPGPPLPGQNRSPSSPAVAGEYVGKCGGNYDAINYLDPAVLATAVAYTGTRFNAFTSQVNPTHVDYASDSAGRNAMSASPPALPKNVLAQPISTQTAGTTAVITNDRVLAITNEEIFTRLLSQNHSTSVTAKINETLLKLKDCLQATNPAGELPSAGLLVSGNKKVGKLDPSIVCAGAPELDRWRDNIWYAMIPKANSPTKINCTGACANTCDGALVFSGTRTTAQRRSDAAERAVASNYLEAGLALFTDPTNLEIAGPTTFGLPGNISSTDIATCLTHPTATNDLVDVAEMSDQLATNASGQTLLARDIPNNTITLGNPASASGSFGGASAVGCTWSINSQPFGSGIRIYFNFRYTYYDPTVLTPVGPGFTFALVDAEKNSNDVCGGAVPNGSVNRGQLMGYAGVMKNAFGNVISTIAPPKMAVEFDTARNTDRNDVSSSHLAVVYWGVSDGDGDGNLDNNGDGFIDQNNADDDNKHATPLSPQSATQRDPVNDSALVYPCLRSTFAAGTCNDQNVLDRVFHVRIDIDRIYDASFPDPIAPATTLGRSSYYTRIWINQNKLNNMDNLSSDFKDFAASPSPDLENRDVSVPADGTKDRIYFYNTNPGVEAFKLLHFGFTIAQPNSLQQAVISGLAVKARP